MPEQDQNTGTERSEDAPNAAAPAKQPGPVDTRTIAEIGEADAKPTLPPNPMASLRQVFRDVTAVVGQAKADFILAEFYGVTDLDALRAADLLDAIDKLYEAA